MFIITKTQKRPNVSTPFYFEIVKSSDDYRDYFDRNFIKTGKLLSITREVSGDNLSATTVLTWQSRDCFLEFTTDLFCYTSVIKPSQIYDINNDIAAETTTEETWN